MSTTSQRDAELLAVGKQCSHSSCNLVDFLPFKCHHCQDSFCQEHFKVDDHKCPKYDESQHNRVAPNCPLCNIPIAFRQGQDPNVRMDQHLETECSVTTGRVKSKSTPVCARPTCKKVLFSPIRCDKCRQQFCPAHRFPGDHTCASQTASSTAQSNMYSRFEATSKGLAAKASAAASSAASSAAKKSPTTAKPIAKASSAPAAGSSTTSNAGPKLPFAKMKTNSRAKAERESRLKAMRARAQKGLLSDEQLVILEAEEAAAKDGKDCIVM
ncbi:hypothetical protein CPB83DRAFT_951338 [Crepidotus variabilis]|uniref:AN1-type domain-containing protein n=1 Tax=Crepidotus variabilis TaxID=179855 RepID=A0A9P6JK45_9AGAR|nr:hypothetical protein CPB83DRAFT_951338 [Crepidotus variabilis]